MVEKRKRTFADLSKYVKKSPNPAIIVAAVAIGVVGVYLYTRNIYLTALIVVVPYILNLVLDQATFRITATNFPLRRNLTTVMITMWFYILFTGILVVIFPWLKFQAIPLGISFTAFFRYLILYIYFSKKPYANILVSLYFSISLIPVFIYLSVYPPILEIVLFSLFSAALAALFVSRSTKIFKEKYEEEPTNLIKFFLLHGFDRRYNEIGERFFKRMYNQIRSVPVKVIALKEKNGGVKTIMVFPYVHPGPFGTVGSSDLPIRLQQKLNDMKCDLMVFHTTTTNDNNCSGEEDITSISTGIRKALGSTEKADFMSKPRRINASKYAISIFKFGNFGFGAILPERAPFDDVSLPEGRKIMEAVAESGAFDFAVIDAQSNFTPGVMELMDCSPLVRPFQREFHRMESKYPINAGYARGSYNTKSLGEMGIQILTLRHDSEITAVILTDSNNITYDLMKKIREEIGTLCKTIEIYTTDNHVVNGSTLDMNPLGEKDDNNKLVEKIKNITEQSISTIAECTAEMGSEDVDVKMGSEESYQELLDTVFSSVKASKRLAAIIIPAAFFVPLIITYLVSIMFP